jgi:hypothetical protein
MCYAVLRGNLLTELFHAVFGEAEKVFAFSHSLSLHRALQTSVSQQRINEGKRSKAHIRLTHVS